MVWIGKNRKDQKYLEELLTLNKVIDTILILKQKLKHIWPYQSRTWADKSLAEWCTLARTLNHLDVTKSTRTFCPYRYGILNHCDYPIRERVNSKIKLIKSKAYGYHDLRYFALKIIQAFIN